MPDAIYADIYKRLPRQVQQEWDTTMRNLEEVLWSCYSMAQKKIRAVGWQGVRAGCEADAHCIEVFLKDEISSLAKGGDGLGLLARALFRDSFNVEREGRDVLIVYTSDKPGANKKPPLVIRRLLT